MLPFQILGHTVEYVEHIERWRWRDDEGNDIFSDPQLPPVRAAIERHEAKQAKLAKGAFKEWDAVLSDWNQLRRVTVISEADANHVWVRHRDKRRSKEKLRDLKPFAECKTRFVEYEEAQTKIIGLNVLLEEIRQSIFPKS